MRVPLLLLPCVAACASVDWREAVQADTSAAYLAYVAHNPTSVKIPTAERRAEALLWEEATLAGTSAGFAAYVSTFPQGKHAAEALTQVYEVGWTEASTDGSSAALQAYALRWPRSPHAPEAAARVEELAFGAARSERTDESLSRYLVQYPEGRHAAEVRALRDEVVWEATVPVATRAAYQRYLDQFPQGIHADTARLWLRATYVRRVLPVLAVLETWQRGSVRTVLGRVQRELDVVLVPDLRRAGFEVLPVRALDATLGMNPPQEQFGVEPDTGILVVEYRERAGRTFDPSGTATDIEAVVRLYVPNTPNPVWVRTVRATTPDRVHGSEVGALHQAAIDDFGDQLHTFEAELASQYRKEEGA